MDFSRSVVLWICCDGMLAAGGSNSRSIPSASTDSDGHNSGLRKPLKQGGHLPSATFASMMSPATLLE